jgi:excisionase family DNA binding protein
MDLDRVIEAWPHLPPSIRDAILVLVDATIQLSAQGRMRARKRPKSIDETLLEDGTMTVPQAAKFTGYSRRSIERMVDDGTLPKTQMRGDGRWLIPKRAVIDLLKKNMVESGNALPDDAPA